MVLLAPDSFPSYAGGMRRALTTSARLIGSTGLAAVAALHVVWAAGSSWPAKNKKQLAEATIGSTIEMPSAGPTLVVAAGTGAAAAVASGTLGNGCVQRTGLRLMGTALIARSVLGGEAALALLGLPESGKKFRELDERYYRPLTLVLGGALWVAASSPRKGRAAKSCCRPTPQQVDAD